MLVTISSIQLEYLFAKSVLLNGRRATASGAFLSTNPCNLIISTSAAVERVLFERQVAVGVESAGRRVRRPNISFCNY